MKSVAILQSNYIPWKGYFDLIARVDTFVIYDDMQYTKRDWRNRNKIKTPQGLSWLSIPVQVKGKYFQKINETHVVDQSWALKHWGAIQQNYAKTAYFQQIAEWLKPLYVANTETNLSLINQRFIRAICDFLEIDTQIVLSSDFELKPGKSERLANLCLELGATEYVSGPSAKDYIDRELFVANDIDLTWFDYSEYPIYAQLHGAFEHSVTILDLLFNVGQNAADYMKFVR